jgi:photosystem II stability/assembly factor-like uncharacterized protein
VLKFSVRAQGRGAALAAAGAVVAGVLALAACGTVASASPPAGSSSSSPPARSSFSSPPAGSSSRARLASSSQPVGDASSVQSSSSPGRPDALAGFRVLSMSFVSDQSGFALGTVSCGTGRCIALLGTTDGGSSWRPLAAPTRAAGGVYNTCPAGQPCVQQVRFATPLTGYAYDPSLLVTTDGGEHWSPLAGVNVSSLEAADGTVVRVASAGTGCSGMPYQADAAPVGSTAWRTLPAPAIPEICPPVLYRQGERLVLVGYGNPAGGVRATAQIARSGDDGQTWASGPDSCGGRDGYASGVALAPPDVLVLLCQHQMPGATGVFGPAWVRVSVDGGASFGPDQTVPSAPAAPPGTIQAYQLAAARADQLLIAETGQNGSRVLLTENGGRTWSATLNLAASGPAVLVGYQDPVTGRIAQGDLVWTTRDGGRTWIADQF